jgi:hypothetical protein
MSRELNTFDNTVNKIRRGRSRVSTSQSIYDSLPPPASSGASTGQADNSGEDTNPNGDTGALLGQYAIKINGTSPSEGEGVPVPSSSYTISVNDGQFTVGGSRVSPDSGELTTILTDGPSTSASFPIGDGAQFYTVYGAVRFGKDDFGFLDEIKSASSIFVRKYDDVGSLKEGFSKLDTDEPEYVFQIGSVGGTKRGFNRWVHVSQVHVGPRGVENDPEPMWSKFDSGQKTLDIGADGKAQIDKIIFTNDGESLLNINADDFTVTTGKPIKVAKLVETDSAGVTTDKGHVLASQDIDITDKDVEWAEYNGSPTAAGSLEIGGSNTSGVTNIDVEMTNGSKMTLKDGSGDTLDLSSGSLMLDANATGTRCSIGSDSSMNNGFAFNCVGASTGGRGSLGQANLILVKESYGGVGIRADDIPTSHDSEAKFREVKVCNNGVPATAYILMTSPKND